MRACAAAFALIAIGASPTTAADLRQLEGVWRFSFGVSLPPPITKGTYSGQVSISESGAAMADMTIPGKKVSQSGNAMVKGNEVIIDFQTATPDTYIPDTFFCKLGSPTVLQCKVPGGSDFAMNRTSAKNVPTGPPQTARPSPPPTPPPAAPNDAVARGATGPQLVQGLTRAQCAARGGRITTFTNTAGQGPDVGDCLVPPSLGANAAPRSEQQSGPASAQAPSQQPQQGGAEPRQADAGPAPPPTSPRVAALPPDPPQVSGASRPPAAMAAPASTPYRLMVPQSDKVDPDSEYCRTTPELDRTSALYGMLCIPDTPAQAAERADRNSTHYADTSPVKPHDLVRRAEEACPLGAQMNLRQQARCMEQFKLSYLLANEPAVGAECASVGDLPPGVTQAECVNAVYLYGRGAGHDLRRLLADSLRAGQLPEWIEALTEWHPEPKPLAPVDGCPLGLGLKPDRNAFGAYACQPLGEDAGSLASNAAPASGSRDAVAPEEIEQRINRVADQVVAAVAARAGKKLSAGELKTCMDAAFAAARGLLKGGFPKVSPTCRELTTAAMAEFAFYQRTGVRVLDPQNETLLAVLGQRYGNSGGSLGGNLGPPLPGMTGIEPNAEERRQMDCVARGGTREDCIKAPATSAPQTAPHTGRASRR